MKKPRNACNVRGMTGRTSSDMTDSTQQQPTRTERDELAEAIDNNFEFADYRPTFNEAGEITGSNVADAIRALGYRKPRQVTTVEELDALPAGSMILDSDPDALVTDGIFWRSLLVPEVDLRSTNIALPATVLHVGGAE